MKYLFFLILSFGYFNQIRSQSNLEKKLTPNSDFDSSINNYQLDYSERKNWAFRADYDNYQKLISKKLRIKSSINFDVNVFFIHPTTLYNSEKWNSDTSMFGTDPVIDLSLENQVSCFAGIADIYVPHYRQMHIYSYVDTINGYKAYDVAFNDVLQAFKYFIKYLNNDKDFILAGHSQGTNHAMRLITEYIQYDTDISSKLLLSYLIGMNVKKSFSFIPPCESSEDLFCFLSWRTFLENNYPTNWEYGNYIASINPISWTNDSLPSTENMHQGILFPNGSVMFKNSLSVFNHKGLLWLKRPKNLLLNLYPSKNYHPGDYNLFWNNIRNNLYSRLKMFYVDN